MTEHAILEGAEPWSAEGGPRGALILHGFTGSPQSMRPLAEAFANAGFSVELPRLPGHGTNLDDMAATSWSDWSHAAEAAYQGLAARCESVVVAGLSMGGSLTAWLATRHPQIAGIVLINGAFGPIEDEMRAGVAAAQQPGIEGIAGRAAALVTPAQHEVAHAD